MEKIDLTLHKHNHVHKQLNRQRGQTYTILNLHTVKIKGDIYTMSRLKVIFAQTTKHVAVYHIIDVR